MNKNTLSVIVYGIITISITVMLILFSGTLSNKDKLVEFSAIKDEMFVPESVVKLSDENDNLRAEIKNYSEQLKNMENDITDKDKAIALNNEKIEVFNKLSNAASFILNNDYNSAQESITEIDYESLDDNARAIYNIIKKEIK